MTPAKLLSADPARARPLMAVLSELRTVGPENVAQSVPGGVGVGQLGDTGENLKRVPWRDTPTTTGCGSAALRTPRRIPTSASSYRTPWRDRAAAQRRAHRVVVRPPCLTRPLGLWALNQVGAIDGAAADLYRRYGPTNRLPGTHLFENPPADRDWQSQLAAHTRLIVTAATALAEVRDAWPRTADTP